jgi:putative ABC transport system ATP-binding protein
VINFKGVTKIVEANRKILDNISFAAKAGGITGIIGPSGSGKTSLLHIAAGLDRCFSGSCVILDYSLPEQIDLLDSVKRESIGMIFQENSLLSGLTILENTALNGLVKYGSGAVKRAEYFLDLLGIISLKNKKPSLLSTGERKKASFARALVNDPEVILADEPFAGIDTSAGEKLFDFLYDYAAGKGCAVIIVTHNSDIAEKCNYLFSLKNGNICKLK